MQQNKNLHIAMIGQKRVPSRFGGIDVVVERLSKELMESGNSILLFNRRRKEEKPLKEYDGATVKECFTINTKAFDALIYSFFATIKAKKLAKKGELDVIHFHSEGVCGFLDFFPKREKRNYKIIVTVHGIDSQRAKFKGLGSKVLRSCEHKIAKYADEIIVLNERDAKYFKDNFNRETILIPNAIDLEEVVGADLIEKNWQLQKDKYILTVARLVAEKGIHYLIDAWQNLSKDIKGDKKLVIAGSFAHDKKYFSLIKEKSKGDNSIIFTDFVEGKALKELYSNAKLFVLPSELEGMSMALLEALSFGKDCLVSDIIENKSVLNDKGLTFKSKDAKDLQSKLEDYLSGKISASVKGVKLYTWKEIAQKTLELYKK